MKFLSVCFFIFLFSVINTAADVVASPYVYKHEQEFRFRPGIQQPRYEITNFLLQTLADGNQKLRVFTSYSLSGEILFEPVNSNGRKGVKVTVGDMVMSGDITYREFSVSEVLKPGMLEFRLLIKDQSGRGLHTLLVDDFNLATDNGKIFDLPITNNRNNDLTFEVVQAEFYYHEYSLNKFNNWSAGLSTYYKAETMLNQASDLIDGLTYDNPESVILGEFRLCEAEVLLGELRFAPFHKHIDLSQNDPLNIKEGISDLDHKLSQLRKGFNFSISHIDSLLYTQGVGELESGNISRGRELFQRALVYNPMHVPAHLALAEFELQEGRADLAMNRLGSFMGKVTPAGVWVELARDFAKTAFDRQIKLALETMADGRYLDALNQLKILDSFCNIAEIWECPEALFRSLQMAHYGMYNSYLSVAQRAYQSSNYSFAETYAESAVKYQRENFTYLPDDYEVIRLLNLVYDAYIRNSQDARIRMDFGAAVNYVDRAMALCESYPRINCVDNLAQLREEIHERRISTQRITVDLTIQEPQIILTELDSNTVRQLVTDHLSQGHLDAWAGRTNDARRNLNTVMGYSMLYDLRSDTIINMRIISLGDMIMEKECELKERDIRTLLASVQNLTGRQQHMEAYQEYLLAARLHEESAGCDMDFGEELRMLSFTEKTAHYQRLVNDAQRAYFRAGQEGFQLFLERYQMAEVYFANNDLGKYGISHELLIGFVQNASNLSLLSEAVRYMADKNEHTNTVILLNEMKKLGVNPSGIRDIQEHAGEMAAIYYHNTRPTAQPRNLSRELTHNDNFFKYYVGSFVRNWPR
jgi:hypothetical protein